MKGKFYSLQSSTGYWVTRLARAIEADFEARLEEHNVTRASFAVLSAITHHDVTTPAVSWRIGTREIRRYSMAGQGWGGAAAPKDALDASAA